MQIVSNNNFPYRLTTKITSTSSGYLQLIDYDKALKLAVKYNYMIEILFRPGHYLWAGQTAFIVHHQTPLAENLVTQLNSLLALGIRRNTVQDIEFAFEQLAEIAIRALSPSMANPFTAINCVNRIAYAFHYLNQFTLETAESFDKDHYLRLKKNPFTFTSIVNTAFDRLRQQAKDDLAVSIRMLEIIQALFLNSLQPELENALYQQAQAIFSGIDSTQLVSYDQSRLMKRYQAIKRRVYSAAH